MVFLDDVEQKLFVVN